MDLQGHLGPRMPPALYPLIRFGHVSYYYTKSHRKAKAPCGRFRSRGFPNQSVGQASGSEAQGMRPEV